MPPVDHSSHKYLQVVDNRKYISYSEVSTWMTCHWRHKLKYLDEIDLDKQSVHTEFGRAIHGALEQYLPTRQMPDPSSVKEKFLEYLEENKIETPNPKEFQDTIEPILEEVPGFMTKQFGEWEFVAAEEQLFETISDSTTKKFKGFIDVIIKSPKEHRLKKCKPGEMEYNLCDWKSTGWGWSAEKKRDPQKTMQLAFYKKFWGERLQLNLKELRCAFILLKRTTKKERCEYVPVSIGPKVLERASDTLEEMMSFVEKGLFPKKYGTHCDYCPYRRTTHCP